MAPACTRSEHGIAGVRLLVGLGLVVALVWAVPFVLLDRGGHESSAKAAQQPADHQASATGKPDVASDPIGAAADLQAQSTLNEAVRGAQVYYAEHGTFDGYGPDVAKSFEPSVVYTAGAAAPGMVSMIVTTDSVVLVTEVDRGGGYLCAAANGDLVTFGRSNASAAGQCSGGWN